MILLIVINWLTNASGVAKEVTLFKPKKRSPNLKNFEFFILYEFQYFKKDYQKS